MTATSSEPYEARLRISLGPAQAVASSERAETHVQNFVGGDPSSVAERNASEAFDAVRFECVLHFVDEREGDLLGRVGLDPFAEVEGALLVTFHRSGITLQVVDDIGREAVGSERIGEEETVRHRVYTENTVNSKRAGTRT